MIGLTGAHRTGKTTLALGLSQELGIPSLLFNLSEVFAREGVDPSQPLTFDERLEIQWSLLMHMESRLWDCRSYVVTDRTPVDCLAYLLSYLPKDKLTKAQKNRLNNYVYAAYSIMNQFYEYVALVPSFGGMVADGSKICGEMTAKAQKKIHLIINGLLTDKRLTTDADRITLIGVTDPQDRVRLVAQAAVNSTGLERM